MLILRDGFDVIPLHQINLPNVLNSVTLTRGTLLGKSASQKPQNYIVPSLLLPVALQSQAIAVLRYRQQQVFDFLENRRLIGSLLGLSAGAISLAFEPQGQQLAVGLANGQAGRVDLY